MTTLAAQPKDLSSNCHGPHQTARRGPTHLQPQLWGEVEAGRSLGKTETRRFLGLAAHQLSNRFSERPVSREQGGSRADDILFWSWQVHGVNTHTLCTYIRERERERAGDVVQLPSVHAT